MYLCEIAIAGARTIITKRKNWKRKEGGVAVTQQPAAPQNAMRTEWRKKKEYVLLFQLLSIALSFNSEWSERLCDHFSSIFLAPAHAGLDEWTKRKYLAIGPSHGSERWCKTVRAERCECNVCVCVHWANTFVAKLSCAWAAIIIIIDRGDDDWLCAHTLRTQTNQWRNKINEREMKNVYVFLFSFFHLLGEDGDDDDDDKWKINRMKNTCSRPMISHATKVENKETKWNEQNKNGLRAKHIHAFFSFNKYFSFLLNVFRVVNICHAVDAN